jgi:hypothetical protein
MIDNVGDTVAGIGDTISGAGPGVDGSGTLVTVDVTGVSPGTDSLSLANQLFLDFNLDTIPFTEVDSSITVEADSPEPASWNLALLAILTMFLCRYLGSRASATGIAPFAELSRSGSGRDKSTGRRSNVRKPQWNRRAFRLASIRIWLLCFSFRRQTRTEMS